MSNSSNEDTTIKLSKKTMEQLAQRAKPFETRKDCLERIISENCSTKKEKGIMTAQSLEVEE